MPATPEHGDIIVAFESSSTYTLRRHPHAVQFSASRREDAVRLARGFAQQHGVDVWYVEQGTNRLLEVYRRRTSGAQASHERTDTTCD